MKKIFAITTVFFCAFTFAFAQMDESIKPEFEVIDFTRTEIVLPPFDSKAAHISDGEDAKNGKLPMFARNISCDIDAAGESKAVLVGINHPFHTVIYHKITSKGALGLVMLFDKFYLPPGATMHIYSPDKKQVLGAFTHANTPNGPIPFNAGIIVGESCIIEYKTSIKEGLLFDEGILHISEIGHAYRWIKDIEDVTGVEASGSCEVNVACSETNNWLDQKRAVARILVVASGGQGFCTGTLVNNVRQDCTPYFLSAQHCSEGATANQYSQWVFYFNYEAATCAGTTGPQNKTVTGCTKIADSNDNGGETGSDFLLLQLNQAPPGSYNAYYAGWDATGTASVSGVSIHHPDGDIKKISTYTQTITSTEWGNTVQDTHWNVKWAATANGHGVTEPGSSGSGLFSSQGLLIGTLTGGNSFCTSPNAADQYGKVAYDWITNGTGNNRRLKPWLDPDNTGALTLTGTNAPCGSSVQNDAGIQALTSPQGNICSLTFTPSFVLRNYGGNTLQTVTISYQIDGNGAQYTWTGTLAAGSSTTVNLTPVTLNAGVHSMTVETISPNGANDNNNANDAQTVSFAVVSPNNALNLYLRTDSYGSETSWSITDNNGTEVASAGPFTDVTGGQTTNTTVCLPPGCYTFTINDTYGDGMADGGSSDFALTGPGGSPEYATLTNRAFGNTETHNFCITGTGIHETNLVQVKVVPNPSTGLFTVSFGNNVPRDIQVSDALGRTILQSKVTGNTTQIDLSQQPKGVYILLVQGQNEKAVSKLVVE